MIRLLGNLLHTALWGSVILLLVFAVRPVLKKKSNRIMCILWFLVMFRFLCPVVVKLPMPWLNMAASNTFNAISSRNGQEKALNARAVREDRNEELTGISKGSTDSKGWMACDDSVIQGSPKDMADLGDSLDPAGTMRAKDPANLTKWKSQTNAEDSMALMDQLELKGQMNRMDQSDPENMVNPANTAELGSKMTVDFFKIFGGIWLGGTVIILLVGIGKYWWIKRALREAIYVNEWEKYPVKISDVSGVPLAFGIWKREIYVPISFEEAGDGAEDAFTRRQKELILWHEAMHLRRLDPMRKVLAFVMVAVHWWNPLVWICVKLMDRDIEMACDEAVLEQVGQKEKWEYARTLLCFAEKQSGLTLITSFGESDAKSRIRNALRYRKPSAWMKAITMLPVLFLGGCLALNPTASAMENQENVENGEVAQAIGDITDNQTSNIVQNDATKQITEPSSSDAGSTNADITGMDHIPVREYIKLFDTDLSYVPEYVKIIDSYLEKYPEEKLCCDLIYFNNDEIPDLWIERCSDVAENISELYIYENGNIYSLMIEEPTFYGYRYYEKKGMLYLCDNIWDGGGDSNGMIDTYLMINSEKNFDCVSVKRNRSREWFRELYDDPNYTIEQILEEERKNGEWEYNDNKISMEEAKKLLKASIESDDYDYVNNLGLEKIKKDLTKLAVGYDHICDTSVLASSLYEKFRQGKERVYFDQADGEFISNLFDIDISCIGEWVPSENGYTISEIMDILRERYLYNERYNHLDHSRDTLKAQFSYIDCGQDGVPEMAVEIQGISVKEFDSIYNMILVIKEKEGKLRCTFGRPVYGGYELAAVNEAGVYVDCNWTNDGRCRTTGEIGMLDADAEYHKIFSCEKIFDTYIATEYDPYESEVLPDGAVWVKVNACRTTIDGKDYTYFVEADTGEEMFSIGVRTDPFCMRREDVVRLEDEALEKYGCTKECLEADDILFFTEDFQKVLDVLRNVELHDPIRP